MIVKKLETIHNEVIEQLNELLYNSFSKKMKVSIEYYIGEQDKQESEGKKGLYIEIISNLFGVIYERFELLKDHEVIADIENEFINKVINDFVLSGISFFNVQSMAKREQEYIKENTLSGKFKNVIPSHIIFLN